MKRYFVYIMTNKPRGTLYIGVTNDIQRRAGQHQLGQGGRFTQKYNLNRLVHFEETSDVDAAIAREKQLKNWRRQWKIELIEADNPDWQELRGQEEILNQVQDDDKQPEVGLDAPR